MKLHYVPHFCASVLAIILLAVPAAHGGAPIVVDGMNDQAVDRQAIQDAIDQADEGDTVRLRGTFQLDGTRIVLGKELRLRGEAIDDDGDGAANEDWLDGVDNDGDGAIDEDDWNTVLRGLVDSNGLPQVDLPDGTFFNRAITIEGLDGEVEDIEIRDIAFFDLHRAISALPDLFDNGGSFACDDLVEVGGVAENLRVRRNRFGNNNRAGQFFGAVDGGQIKDNVALANNSAQLVLVGGVVGCVGAGGPFAIGQPTDIRVQNNVVRMTGSSAFISFETVGSRVSGNTFIGASFGVAINEDVDVRVNDNTIDSAFIGVVVFDAVPGGRVSGNTISNHVFGVLLDTVSGWSVKDNAFLTAGFEVDVFLETTTSDNTVVVAPGTSVSDLGTDNTVIVE